MRSPLRFVLLASAAIIALAPARAQTISSYTGGTGDPAAMTGFSAMKSAMGRTPTSALAYVDSQKPMSQWIASSQYEAGNFASFRSKTSQPNMIPMLGLPMAGPGQNASEAFKQIASGQQDAMLNGVLKAWSDRGFQGLFLRPGFEMNGGWFSWSVTEANAADFVAAFQHITTVAHNFPGAIVSVIWNPNVGKTIPLDAYYPGDKFADVVGMDIYGQPLNSDTAPSDGMGDPTNLTLAQLIAFAKAHGKPFALPEIGAGSSNTNFPTQLASALVKAKADVLVAGFWDVNDSNGQMRWTDNAVASAAWRTVADVIAGSKQVQLVTITNAQGDTVTIPDPGPTIPPPEPDTTPLPPALATDAPQGVPLPPPPADPSASPSQPVTISEPNSVTSDSSPGAQRITVTAPGAIVGVFGGLETVTLQGAGIALTTGPYNDAVTVQSSGNTIDLGWGQDTVTLAYPPAQAQAPITLAAAHATVDTAIGAQGNTFYLPAPQTGLLTINGTLAKGDVLDLSKALAVTTWDHQPSTLGRYVSVSHDKPGATVSVNGVAVARIVGRQTSSIASMMVAN